MACPVGLSAPAACAAIRARINRFQESRYTHDDEEPIVCSELSLLPARMLHRERLLALLGLAVADATQGMDPSNLARIPLLVGTSEQKRPGGVSELIPDALAQLQQEHGVQLSTLHSRCLPMGKTGGLHALAAARELLARDPRLPGCLVAGVDSLVNAPSLWWLKQNQRLKGRGQSDGVIAGEAAACILVTRRPPEGLQPVEVAGLSFAHESATLDSDEPLRAAGLTQASRAALLEAGLSMEDMDFRLSDASGEGYAFKELALVLARVLRVRKETLPLWLPAECLGETGAAMALVSLIWATVAMRRGYAPGPRAISYSASDSGDRAVAVLRAHEVKRGGAK